MLRQIKTTAIITGAALAGLTATAEAATALRVQLPADIRSIDPGVNRDHNTDAVVLHIVEGLVAYGEDAAPKPLLAEKVAISEDGKSYSFTLRQGVKFHNGAEMTSADVVWSWNRYMNPKTDWRCLSEFDGRGLVKVESVTAQDARTVVFQLDKPSALFLTSLARTDCAMTGILHKDSVKADGSFDKPIGTGPFKFADWKRGEFIRLERFADYAALPGKIDGLGGAKRPLVDELRFVVIPDSATAKAALVSGDVDVVPDVANTDVAELKKATTRFQAVGGVAAWDSIGLIIQTRDPVHRPTSSCAGPSRRRSTRTELVGERSPMVWASPIPRSSRRSRPITGKVQEPGRQIRSPRRRRGCSRRPVTRASQIVMLANKRYPQSFDAAVIAQQMLKNRSGINLEIEVLEWATQLDRYSKGNYQIQAFPYSGRLDPSLSFESVTGPKDKQPRKLWDDSRGSDAARQVDGGRRPRARTAGDLRRAAQALSRGYADGDAL